MPYMNITDSELLGLGNRPFRGLRGFSGSASAKLWFESPNPVQTAMLALQSFLGTELTGVWDEPTHLALSDLSASFHDGISTLPAWGANPSRIAESVAELLYCGDDPDSWDALTDLAKALGYGTLTYAESRALFESKPEMRFAVRDAAAHAANIESGPGKVEPGLTTSGKGNFLQTSNPVKTYLLGIQKYLSVEQTGVWDPATYDAVKEWWRVFETSIEGDEQPTEIPAWGAGLTGSGKAPGSLGLELLHVQNGVGVRAPLFAILGLPTTVEGINAMEDAGGDAMEAQFAAFRLDFLRHAASQEQKSRESFVSKSLFSNPWVWGGAGAVALLVLWAATRRRSGGTNGLRGLGLISSDEARRIRERYAAKTHWLDKQKVRSWHPDDPKLPDYVRSGPSNEEVGELEVHDFVATRPKQMFAYYHEGNRDLTVWPGQKVAHITFKGRTFRDNFGGCRFNVNATAITGDKYTGWCACGNTGQYCRLRKVSRKGR